MTKNVILIIILLYAVIALFPTEVIKDIRISMYICFDKDKNIYSRYDNYSIVKYSPQWKQIQVIGFMGEGPGGIKRLGRFDVNPKDSMLYVTEYAGGNRRISIFSTVTGKYIDNWKFDFNWMEWESISCIQFDFQGNVYIEAVKEVWRPYKSFQIGALEKAVFKYSYDGKKVKEFYRMKSDFMAALPGKGNVTIPHSNYLNWKISDNYLFIRENKKNYIIVFDLNGKEIKKILLPIEQIKFTNKDIDAWEKDMRSDKMIGKGIREGWFDLKFWKKNLPFPEYKTLSSYQMLFDSKGFLYSYKYAREKDNANSWLKINVPTMKSSLINFPKEYHLINIKDGFFYFYIDLDEEEFPSILKAEEKSITNDNPFQEIK